MTPLRISFIIRSVYDLLPSNANLAKWGKSEDPACPLCEKKQTVEHVLSSCKVALAQGRYTWRHNQVLKVIADVVSDACVKPMAPKTPRTTATFYKTGGKQSWPGTVATTSTFKQSLLDGADDWDCTADLPGWNSHPEIISKTGMRPDLALHSESSKQVILVELTVPYESRMEEAHIYKTEKYASLASSLRKSGIQVRVFAVEVGARGFVSTSAYDLMKQLAISGKKRTRALKDMAEAAERSSSWIWSKRNNI